MVAGWGAAGEQCPAAGGEARDPPLPPHSSVPSGRGHPWGQQGRALLFAQTLPGAMWCCGLGGRGA